MFFVSYPPFLKRPVQRALRTAIVPLSRRFFLGLEQSFSLIQPSIFGLEIAVQLFPGFEAR